jgi:phage gp29-like protein
MRGSDKNKNFLPKEKQIKAPRGSVLLTQKLLNRYYDDAQKDISDWRFANRAYFDPYNPTMYRLQQLYDKVMLDAHLSSVVQTRILRVKGIGFHVKNEDGSINNELTKAVNTIWLDKFIEETMKAIFYGFSAIEFIPPMRGEPLTQFVTIDRWHFHPKAGLVFKEWFHGEKLNLEDYPNLMIIDSEHEGILNKSVPITLYKFFMQAAMTERAERFGQPYIIGKTNTRNDAARMRMESIIRNMSSGSGGVFDDSENIDFKESSTPDGHKIYTEGIALIDAQNSKNILGQTLTTEAGKVGSQALGNVHEKIADDYLRSDIRWCEFVLNQMLLPQLSNYGYNFGTATFKAKEPEKLSYAQKFDKVINLLPYYDVPAAYIESEFGIPVKAKNNNTGERSQATITNKKKTPDYLIGLKE